MEAPRAGRHGKDRALRRRSATCCPTSFDGEGEDGVALQPPGRRAQPRLSDSRRRLGWAGFRSFPRPERSPSGARLVRLTAAQIAVELSRDNGGSKRPAAFVLGSLTLAAPTTIRSKLAKTPRARHRSRARLRRGRDRRRGSRRSVAAQKNAEIRRVCLDVLGSRTGDVVVDRTRRRVSSSSCRPPSKSTRRTRAPRRR